MARYRYDGPSETYHPELGTLSPGVEAEHIDDALLGRVALSGLITLVLPPPAAPVATHQRRRTQPATSAQE